jgi:tetratricopeptide (TPR) repeat protein
MSPQFTHFALGYAAYLEGRPDSATTELRKTLAIDPEMAAAWMQLGETYTHLLPIAGRVDTLADAAFNEAMRLDSSAVHMLFHPIESRLRRGLADQAAPLLQRFLAAGPDTILAAQLRVMQTCVIKGARDVAWKSEIVAHPLVVLFAAQSLAANGGQLDCAEAAYRALHTFETPEMAATDAAIDARRWTSLVGLTGILVAEGRTDEAMAYVDSAIARKEGGISLYLLGSTIVPAFASRAAQAAVTATQSGAECERCTPERVWQLGVWSASLGDSVALQRFGNVLAARAAKDAPNAALFGRVTNAKLLVQRRDTAAALQSLRAVLESPAAGDGGRLLWTEGLGRGPERLAYARLLAGRREFQRALDVANVFDSPASQSYVSYLPESLSLRASLADSAGLSTLGDWYRARLRTLSAHAKQR